MTMVSEASPPIAQWRPETPFAKVRHAEGDFLCFIGQAPIQISRPPNSGSGTATDPILILLERAGDIAVNEDEDRGDAIANAEASNRASTLSPSMKVEESNDPQVLGRSVGLQKSTGRILRNSGVRKGSALR